MGINIVLGTVGATVAAIGTVYGGVMALDARYAQRELVEDLAWSGMKREIRELRREVEAGEASEEELEELIDRLCRAYPEDRECN